MLPASMVQRLEVFKSFTPVLDGNAIGGVLNLVSKSAFDHNLPVFNAEMLVSRYSLDSVPGDNDDGPGGEVNLGYSNLFGQSSQFGLVLSANYNLKKRDEIKYSNDNYRYDNHLATPVNKNLRTLQYSNQWRRFGGAVKFEYRPNSELSGYLNQFYYQLSEQEHRNLAALTHK
jgi:iron complex outermembrane receptor protein